jgi:DNA-binding CsgD family transcriptional regulator
MGLGGILNHFERAEIINIYQYDKYNFFSIQRIYFHDHFLSGKSDDEVEKYMKKHFGAVQYELLERDHDESITCMMKQKRALGLWTVIPPGPWSLIPPLYIDKKTIILNFITTQKFAVFLFNSIKTFTNEYKILTTESLKEYRSSKSLLLPGLTNRQHEIVKYAIKHGYYEQPRKISSEKIAKAFNISVSTLNEHLRKIERISMYFLYGNIINIYVNSNLV